MGFNQKACVLKTAADAHKLGYGLYTSFDVLQGSVLMKDEKGAIITDPSEIRRIEEGRLTALERGTGHFYKDSQGNLRRIDDINQETEYPQFSRHEKHLKTADGLLFEYQKIGIELKENYEELPVFKKERFQHYTNENAGVGLLLIDLTEDRLEKTGKEAEALLQYCIDVLFFCRNCGLPVFVLETLGEKETIREIRNVVEQIPKHEFILGKSDANGFNHTDLEKKLREHSVNTIIVAGMNASSCVLWTSVGAVERGFRVLASSDLMADIPVWHQQNTEKGRERERTDFYKKKCIFRENYKELLDIICEEKTERMKN